MLLVSLCPRLDDASGNIRRGNIIIEKLANDENCHYVDNESSFRLLNGSINTAQIIKVIIEIMSVTYKWML
jgi:hypothetical protein